MAEIAKLYKRAFIKVLGQEEDSIAIETEDIFMNIGLHKPLKLLQFVTFYNANPSVSAEIKRAFVNEINATKVLARFYYMEDHDKIVADYSLPFEEGISEYQVIAATRLFSMIVPRAVKEHNRDGAVL